MTDDRIKAVFEEYGRIVTGKEYALIHAIAEAVAPQRIWVGLTPEEIVAFDDWYDNREEEKGWVPPEEIVAYIEAKLKEKNT